MSSAPGEPGSQAIRHGLALPSRFGALMLIGFGIGTLPVFLGVLNHDVAWCLYEAGRLMAGDRLYVDLMELNPPLIIWLNVPPQLLARSLGISEIISLRILVLGLVGASLILTRWALLPILPDRPGVRRLVLLLSLFILLPLSGYDFAQREHLMLILFLPYLMMASGRATGRRPASGLALVVGMAAGVGLSIKPHFVLPWLAIEAYLAARRGWRIWSRPEALVVVAVGLTYAVAVVAITPEYLPWMSRIGPVYFASGRSFFLGSWGEPGIVVTAAALLGFLLLWRKGDGGELLELILVAALGFLAIALLQTKGFTYHLYPPFALAVLLVGLLAWGLPGPPSARRSGVALVLMRGTLVLLVLSVAVARVQESWFWRGQPERSDTSLGKMIRVAKGHAEGGPVFVFSAVEGAPFPMVTYSGVKWASGLCALRALPVFHPGGFAADGPIADHPPGAMGEIERFLFNYLVDELLARRPTLLFVDEMEHHPAFHGHRFHYLDYYSLDPRFAEFLRDYEPLTKLDDFRVYRRKARISGPSASIGSSR